MASIDMLHGGGVFPVRTAVGSGSGLYKLVKLGNNGSMHAPTNVEVARIEASFMGPDLHDSDKELLQISGNEEEERKALLERMQAYDMMLSRIETQQKEDEEEVEELKPPSMMTSSDVYTATTMGDAKLTIDFDAQATSQGFEALDSTARKSTNDYLQTQGGGFGGGYDYLDFGCEDDEDEDEDADLLCDFAPGALQADGSMGLMDSDGTHVLIPPTPPDGAYAPHPRFKMSYMMSHGLTEQQQRRGMMLGRAQSRHYANGGETMMMTMVPPPEEQCLSDSWHAAAARSDSSDSSITALRHQYHRVFGKETSSNNRQWLLRRLAEIDAYGEEDMEDHDLDHDHDGATLMRTASAGGAGYHSGDHSGNGSGSGSDLEDATPLYSSLGRHKGIVGGNFFGVADSDHHPASVNLKGRRGSGGIQGGVSSVAVAVGRGSGKRQVKPSRQFNDGNNRAPGRHTAKMQQQHQVDQRQGRKGSGHHETKRSRHSDSHGSEGGSKSAKTDASAASPGKRYKKGHHSDSDDHSAGEPPVKSRNNSHHAQQHQHNHKSAAGRKGLAEGGANGAAPGANTAGANGRRSKHHNPWALEEAEALVEGVARCGGGKWADIKKLGFAAIEHRTAVDLKDKWRNLLRIAMLPHQPVKSAGDKKREIPPELLARVRELAAKQAKKAAQDGRSRGGGRTSS